MKNFRKLNFYHFPGCEKFFASFVFLRALPRIAFEKLFKK